MATTTSFRCPPKLMWEFSIGVVERGGGGNWGVGGDDVEGLGKLRILDVCCERMEQEEGSIFREIVVVAMPA